MLDLRSGKIGIEDEARFFTKQRFEPLGLQSVTFAGRDAALPDDGIRHRAARIALPKDRRFALVRHADRRQIAGCRTSILERFASHHELRRPDRLRVVLNNAGRRQDLRKFLLGPPDFAAIMPENDCPAGAGSLVEGEDVAGHGEW